MKEAKNIIATRVKDFMQQHQIADNSRILCAVSGGIDSTVMLHALLHEGWHCGVAHCNFGLRGAESDAEQQFVAEMAAAAGLEFHLQHFDTQNTAESEGISIQMAARKLRYEWFATLMQSGNYDYLALAHHADDSIETMLINLARGTGIAGITGISPVSGYIIRPLSSVRRSEITAYTKRYRIKYRNDSSNNEVKYHRNLIRHRIIPLFEQINPAFGDCMLENMQRFAQAERLMKTSTEKMLLDCVEKDSNQVLIRLDKLPEGAIENGSLFSLLRNFDVQASYAEEVIKLTQSQPGKYVDCGKTQVLRDRDSLIIQAKKNEVASEYLVTQDTRLLTEPLVLHFEISRNRNPEFSSDSSIAYLDYDCLQFPLVVRRWRKGDRFMPLGMNGFKKLSDFFTDNKLSRFDKENQYLICSGEDIVWVIGYRIDERYKVKKTTKQIFTIQL